MWQHRNPEEMTFTERGRRAQILQGAIDAIVELGYAQASLARIAIGSGPQLHQPIVNLADDVATALGELRAKAARDFSTGDGSIADLTEQFFVSGPTAYRILLTRAIFLRRVGTLRDCQHRYLTSAAFFSEYYGYPA